MTGWVILVDQPKDLPNAETPHKVITTSEYLARPKLFDVVRPKLVNLSRSYAYQSKGYYASLLAEARGHRVVPTVETMLELREAKLYEHALPELEDELNRCARRADFQPESELKLLVCFGIARDQRFESFGRLLFDWFRCPALEVIVAPGEWLSIERIRPRNITRLANGEGAFLREALHQHTKREWRDPKARTIAKYDLAVLFDPPAQHHPARQRRGRLPARGAASAYQARVARPQGAHDREIRPRGAVRSEREDAPHLGGLDQAFRAQRREALRRCRADHPPAARRARRIRWAVHSRDHLD